MPAVTREITITYGGFEVAGTTDRILDGKYRANENYFDFRVEFDTVIHGSSEADFATQVSDFEAAFRKPDQQLTLTLGAQTLRDYDPASNTGFNIRAEFTKSGGDADTGRSRRYQVVITGQLPADLAGRSGRQSSQVTVAFDESRIRTITITGTYTALAGNSALAQYNAAIAAFATSALSGFGGESTYNLISETPSYDDQNKVLTFTRVYREIIFNEIAGTLNDSRIVNQTISVSKNLLGPGDTFNIPEIVNRINSQLPSPAFRTGTPRRLIEITLTCSMSVDRDQTTDLSGLWDTVIFPYMVTVARNLTGATSVAITSQNPVFDPTGNRITATLNFLAVSNSSIISSTMSVGVADDGDRRLVDGFGGNPLIKFNHPKPRTLIRTVTQNCRVLVGVGAGIAGGGAGGAGAAGGNRPGGGGVGAIAGAGAAVIGLIGAQAERGKSEIAGAAASILGTIAGVFSGAGLELGAAGNPNNAGGGAQPNQNQDNELGLVITGLSDKVAWQPLGDPQQRATPVTIGRPPYTIDVIDYEIVYREQAYIPPASGGGRGTAAGRRSANQAGHNAAGGKGGGNQAGG